MAGKSYSVVLVGGEGDPLAAPTLPLVAALIALDCNPRSDFPFKDVFEAGATDADPDRREHVWAFHESSVCGRYHTDKLRKWWRDADWLTVNFAHPLARIRAAFHCSGVLPFADPVRPDAAGRFIAAAETAGPLPPEWHDKAMRRAYLGKDVRAVVSSAFALLPQLRAEVAKSVLLVRVRKGERQVEIPCDASPEEEEFLLFKLEPKK